MERFELGEEGCFCCCKWQCFECQTVELEKRHAKNMVEAEFRRRAIDRSGMDRVVETAYTGWACECGQDIEPAATLLRCTGCRGLQLGILEPQEMATREEALKKTALAWA